MKNEILKQVKQTETAMKEELRTAQEETNKKFSYIQYSVKDNTEKLSKMEERLPKLKYSTGSYTSTSYAEAAKKNTPKATRTKEDNYSEQK